MTDGQKLRGAAHIVQILAFDDGLSQPLFAQIIRMIGQFLLPLGSKWEAIGPGLSGPTVVMEYIENGNLEEFFRRARDQEIRLPNRVLWSFFLCREWLNPSLEPTLISITCSAPSSHRHDVSSE